MMEEAYPDLEIYIKQVALEDILRWLGESFEIVTTEKQNETTHCQMRQKENRGATEVECIIVERAVKGDFTSVWFKRNNTHWDTDENCATDAFSHLQAEVRCSAGTWKGEDEEQGGWLSISKNGLKTINWFTH